MPIPSGLPQAREGGMWNPKKSTQGRDPLEPDLNDPEDRQDWNSDDEAYDEFGRKKTRRKKEGNKTEAVAKKPVSNKAPKMHSNASASDSRVTFKQSAMAAGASSSVLQAKFATGRPGLDKQAVPQAQATSRILQTGRQSSREAAMEVSERGNQSNWKQQNRGAGANTGANMIHLQKQWKPIVPCKFFIEGTCKSGSSCTFLHERPEVCKFLVHGRCMKGASCNASHPAAEETSLSAPFSDFDTGDPTSGLEFASAGQNLMEKLWKQHGNSASASALNPTQGGIEPKSSSQALMQKLSRMHQPQVDQMSASQGSWNWTRPQWDEAQATKEFWGWQQPQVDEVPGSQPSRAGQNADDYWGGSSMPPNQFDSMREDSQRSPSRSQSGQRDKKLSKAEKKAHRKRARTDAGLDDRRESRDDAPAPDARARTNIQVKFSSSREEPAKRVVVQSIPVVSADELTDDEVQSRLQLAREKALANSDADHFNVVADSLIEYIADEEIETAKKFVQDEIKAQTNIVANNERLQNLGRPTFK